MSAQTGIKRSKRFLTSKQGLKKMVEEALTEQGPDETENAEIRIFTMDLPFAAALHDEKFAGCNIGPSINEDLDGSMYAMDFGSRIPRPLSFEEEDEATARELSKRYYNERDHVMEYEGDILNIDPSFDFETGLPKVLSAKELADEAAALELEERFYESEFDERDAIDFELGLNDFFEAAFAAAKDDPQAKNMLGEILETHISPEARAICTQADRNNPTIENKDRQFFDNVIGDAAEHAMEQSRNEDHFDNPPIKSL